MKKFFMMIAALAMAAGMQAQSKFHDVEVNEAIGPVKSITQDMMGRNITVQFSQDGKMQREGMSDAVYDANGFLQSVKMSMGDRGEMTMSYKWENGKVKSQTMNMMGNEFTTEFKYNDKGAVSEQIMNMGGQEMSMPYTDYKYDDHGNWISRKTSMMGQEREMTRTIQYYE